MRKSVFVSKDAKMQKAAVKKFAWGGNDVQPVNSPTDVSSSLSGGTNYNWMNVNNDNSTFLPRYRTAAFGNIHELPTVEVGGNKRPRATAADLVITGQAPLELPDAPTRLTAGASPSAPQPMTKQRINVFSKFGDIVPYISNIANSFRRAPLPNAPGIVNPVYARRVNYDNQRAEADRMTRGTNLNLDRTLDENTAAAAKATNLASNIRAKNSISEAESNTNAQLQTEADRVNAGIEGQNVGMNNQWKRDLVEAQVANQREQSANLANAADKYIGQQDNKARMNLDMLKWNTIKPMWQASGVADRKFGEDTEWAKKLRESNPDLYEGMYGHKAFGGEMYAGGGRIPPKPHYNFPSAYMVDMWHPDFSPSAADSSLYRKVFNGTVSSPMSYNSAAAKATAENIRLGHVENPENMLDKKRIEYLNAMIEANAIDDAKNQLQKKASGGEIHINPNNRGKFTASAKSAGMGTQEFASHVLANKGKYSTTQVRRAVFAKNASKWH